ncbi:hypothetical protein EDD22DRAFT_844772 [Suillus occidentalis]|nr:hypothetical protein EDD22DRAFT_844772 [Suillus occidentalis]
MWSLRRRTSAKLKAVLFSQVVAAGSAIETNLLSSSSLTFTTEAIGLTDGICPPDDHTKANRSSARSERSGFGPSLQSFILKMLFVNDQSSPDTFDSLNTWDDSEGPFVRDALGYLEPSANLCY